MAEPITQIEVARGAAARRDWTAAYEGFHGVDPALLSATDLIALADAAWWCSRFEESMAARQDAYTVLVAAGDQRLAGAMAARLAIEFLLHEEPSVAMGFMGRAQRHMRDLPDCVEQGYLRMVESVVARETGRMEEALELARKAVASSERFGDRDLLALSLHTEGVILLASGEVGPGLALMDEAMSAVLADQIDPYFAGIIYCSLIAACLDLSDIQRAGEWSDAATVWCASLPPGAPYIGMCRVNRAEVAQIRGSWAEAQAEAALATEELHGIDPWAVGSAHYQIGEIHRRRGDGAEAEAAYARAHALGREPQPGLALLRLGQGKQDAAVAAMRTALAGTSEWSRRSRLLPAQVEVALAVGDGAGARVAFEELHAMMGPAAPATMLAVVATAEGAVLLAEDEVHRATQRLHEALRLWQRVKAPYDTARARALYGLALAAGGDQEGALLEHRAALSAFERLGARPDVEAMMAILGDPAALPGGLTEREAEVLRLVSAGKTNRDIAVELVISEHTVARHLQNMYTKLGVSSRSGATAFAFEHGLA